MEIVEPSVGSTFDIVLTPKHDGVTDSTCRA
jgi:hypothetical protein